MGYPKIIYIDRNADKKNSWIRYIGNRVFNEQNNNLIFIVGKTGSGKSWSGLSISEIWCKTYNLPMNRIHLVFNLRDLLILENSGILKRGDIIVYDEPQTGVNSRTFMSKANLVLQSLLSTVRSRGWTLLFCCPFDDMVDKTARKLCHAIFNTKRIDRENKLCILKPLTSEYSNGKFYQKYLRIVHYEEGKSRMTTSKLKEWAIPKPSKELIDKYEIEKDKFQKKLYINLLNILEKDKNFSSINGNGLEKLSQQLIDTLYLMIEYKNKKKVAQIRGTTPSAINYNLETLKNKGFDWESASNMPEVLEFLGRRTTFSSSSPRV